MPRPRRDSEILPAKERLENAFWELLSEREYRKITVTDIVRTADAIRGKDVATALAIVSYNPPAMEHPMIVPNKQRPGWTHGCVGAKRCCASGSQKSVTVN